MSSFLDRLKFLSKNRKKKNVRSNVSFLKAIRHIEKLETFLNCLPETKVDPMRNEGPVTYEMDGVFTIAAIEWRTTSVTERFIIATRSDITGGPDEPGDVIRASK